MQQELVFTKWSGGLQKRIHMSFDEHHFALGSRVSKWMNNAWIAMNNDYEVTSEVLCPSFHEWRSHELKSLKNHITSDQKIVIHGKECIIIFLTCNICSEHSIPLETTIDRSFAIVAKEGILWLSIVTSRQLLCDVTWTRGTSIVTSYSSIVLPRTNWHKGDLQ